MQADGPLSETSASLTPGCSVAVAQLNSTNNAEVNLAACTKLVQVFFCVGRFLRHGASVVLDRFIPIARTNALLVFMYVAVSKSGTVF